MGQIHMTEAWARRLLLPLSQGASNQDIARQMFISPQTVKVYLTQLYRFLGAKNRANAVAIGYRDNLIKEWPT